MISSRNLNRATPYLFLAPAGIVLIFALLYPIGYLTVASFFDWRMGSPFADSTFAGLGNYTWILNDPSFRESFMVTITFAFAVVVLEMFLGVGLAFMLERPHQGYVGVSYYLYITDDDCSNCGWTDLALYVQSAIWHNQQNIKEMGI